MDDEKLAEQEEACCKQEIAAAEDTVPAAEDIIPEEEDAAEAKDAPEGMHTKEETPAAAGAEKQPFFPKDDGSVLASVLAGIAGGFVALILCTLLGGKDGSLLYLPCILFPLLILAAIRLFGGRKGAPGMVCEVVFSFLGLFLLPVFLYTSNYLGSQGVSRLVTPLYALANIGDHHFLKTAGFRSATIYPILFILIGLAIACTVFKYEGQGEALPPEKAEKAEGTEPEEAAVSESETEKQEDDQASAQI